MAQNIRINFGDYIFDNRNRNIRKRPFLTQIRSNSLSNKIERFNNPKTQSLFQSLSRISYATDIALYNVNSKSIQDNNDLNTLKKQYPNLKTDQVQYAYDQSYAQKLFYSGQRREAIAYLEQYHFSDPTRQQQHKLMISNLERSSNQLDMLANRAPDQLTRDALFFKDAASIDKGIDYLPDDNHYKSEYQGLLKNILTNKDTGIQGSKIRIRFDDKYDAKFAGINVGQKDNKNNLHNWLNNNNLNKDLLRNAGVSVWQKGDSWFLDFDASNIMAKDILGSVVPKLTPYEFNWRLMPTVSILDDKNNLVNEFGGDTYRHYPIFLREEAIPDKNSYNASEYLQASLTRMAGLKNEIDGKVKKLTDTVNDPKSEDGQYVSSTIGPLLYYKEGKYENAEDFNKQTKAYQEILARKLQAYDVNSFEDGLWYSYSNLNKDKDAEKNSNVLKIAGAMEKDEVLNIIKSVDPSDMTFNSMMMDGKIGSLITIPLAKYNQKDYDKMFNAESIEDIKARPILSVFVPGLYAEDASAAFGDDSTIQAHKEMNSLKDYKYPYEAENGEVYSCRGDGTGGYIFTNSKGETVDEGTVLKEINKDKIIDQAYDALITDHVNSNGEFINFDSFEADLKNVAVKAAADIWDRELTHDDGSPIDYTNADDIKKFFMEVFSKRNSDGSIDEQAMRSVNYTQALMYKDIIDIYNAVLRGSSYYTKYN